MIKHINRRDALTSLAGFTMAARIAPMRAAATAGAAVAQTDKQPPSLDGELRFDEEVRTASADEIEFPIDALPIVPDC
jgi:hypothetical protein